MEGACSPVWGLGKGDGARCYTPSHASSMLNIRLQPVGGYRPFLRLTLFFLHSNFKTNNPNRFPDVIEKKKSQRNKGSEGRKGEGQRKKTRRFV